MDISSSGQSPFVVAVHTCETSASATYCMSTRTERVLRVDAHRTRTACRRTPSAYCMSTCTERVLLFRSHDANSRIVNLPAVHDGARTKRPRLFQANRQETDLRQRRTFRKWRHNLAVYYAVNLHGSCVNSAKSA